MRTHTRDLKFPRLILVIFIVLLVSETSIPEESDATKYLTLLLERPEPGLLFDRFVEASLREATPLQLEQSLHRNREKNPAFTVLLGHWFLRQDQPGKAIQSFAGVAPSEVPGIDYWKAVALHRNKKIDEAIRTLDLAMGDKSINEARQEEIPRLKGQWFLEQGRPQ